MKNKSLFMVPVIALLAFAGLLVTACKDEDDPAPTTYTVTFNSNGGTAEADPTTKTVTDGQTVDALPSNPTKTNYTFVAWNTKAEGTGTTFTASTKVTANITVYAQWTENLTDVNYTLSTDSTLNPAGLEIESAKKGVVSGVTTVVLKGTITSGIPSGLATDFVASTFATDVGVTKYSAFTIKGLELGAGVKIKQTNNSNILYKGRPGYNDPTWDGGSGVGNGAIIVTNGTHVKTKTYDTDPNVWDGGFDILFADGVTPETDTLEITPAGKSAYTVIIDWSNVTFNSAS